MNNKYIKSLSKGSDMDISGEGRIVAREEIGHDEWQQTIRPQKLCDYIGQTTFKENLSIYIQAAKVGSEPERATAMLTLAMQLHDQYVDKGKAKAQQIVEESQARYNDIVAKADEYSGRTRTEADEYNKQTRGDADDYSVRTRGDADAYAARAHNEADAYSGKVRQAADDYSKQTHDQADQYEAEVQHRAADYDSTTRTSADAYARQVRENLEKQTKVIEGNIQSLKQFETEYRTRLTDFLGQLVAQVSDENTYTSMENQDKQDK